MNTTLSILSRSIRSNQLTCRELNCWTAAITKKHRKTYERTYPTILVHPDGSSINIQYYEPRKIVVLPLDLSTLSEAERRARIERRKPKTIVKIEEELEDDFDEDRYVNMKRR